MKLCMCSHCNQVLIKLIDREKDVTCCGEKTLELVNNPSKDKAPEHLPVIRKIGNFVTITVGEEHPMIDVHYISVIVLETNHGFQYKYLSKNLEAKAEFILAKNEEIVNVYVYCNIHQLWSLY